MGLRRFVDHWGDGVLAFGLAAWAQLDAWSNAPSGIRVVGGDVVLAALLVVTTVPLAWRRRAPWPALAVVVAGLVAFALLVSHGHGLPVAAFLAVLLAFFSVGAHCDDRRAAVAGLAGLAAIAAVDLAHPGLFDPSARPGAWVAFGVALLVGRDLRRRREREHGLEDRAARLEREREEQERAVGDERARIARELHDVVAHGVSVIVVQAQAGPHLLHDPDRAREVFGAIESSGRDALVELRRLLGILRSDDQQLAIGPQPGLRSLEALIEQLRASGQPVEVRFEGEPLHLPAGIDLSAFRIVQEALTNTVKHARGATVEVVVRYQDDALDLTVVDDGRGTSTEVNGSGHGLVGMRERVALYGGTLHTGPGEHGGYAVHARLPVEDRR